MLIWSSLLSEGNFFSLPASSALFNQRMEASRVYGVLNKARRDARNQKEHFEI